MADYFYSLEMLLCKTVPNTRGWFSFLNSVLNGRELADEENQ